MSKAEEFRQYAEEAFRWAVEATTEKEKQALIDLARTWTQAAMQIEAPMTLDNKPPENSLAP